MSFMSRWYIQNFSFEVLPSFSVESFLSWSSTLVPSWSSTLIPLSWGEGGWCLEVDDIGKLASRLQQSSQSLKRNLLMRRDLFWRRTTLLSGVCWDGAVPGGPTRDGSSWDRPLEQITILLEYHKKVPFKCLWRPWMWWRTCLSQADTNQRRVRSMMMIVS